MVEPRYNFICDIFRLERDGSMDAYGDDPVYSSIPFQILSADTDIVAVFGAGPTFALYECITGKDVILQNGDKLISGDRTWIVQGNPEVVNDPLLFSISVIGQEAV